MKYYIYILKTVNDTLYCGITPDIIKRYSAHLKGTGAKYTKANKPKSIEYLVMLDDKSAALKEEYRIKHSMNRNQKLEFIEINKKKTDSILKSLSFSK